MLRHFLTSPPPSKLAIGLAVLPLAIPITYLVYHDRVISNNLKTFTGIRNKKKRLTIPIPPDISKPATLPTEVASDDSEWVLAYERIVSQPVDPSSLPHHHHDMSALLTRYVRATMAAFSWTPQAFLLRASAGDGDVRRTFDTAFIQGLGFREGDRVNGFWRVLYRGDGGLGPQGGERVEMALDAPAGYRGPVVNGVVVAGVEVQGGGEVVFVNETWMWRKQGEPPVLLERGMGRWLHVVLSGWLVMKGVRTVMEGREGREKSA